MKCSELMKKHVEYLRPEATAREAAQKMYEANIGFLPVCEESGRVFGTITDRDIAIRLVANGRSSETSVADIMTRDVIACRPADDITRAKLLMAKYRKSRIICLDEKGHLAGVLSLSDIVQRGDGSQVLREIVRREVHA
jgi:CBS domain-containing protein